MTKRYFLHVLFLLIGLPALAQRPKPAAVSLPPADTVYFDRDWERTETLEEVSFARVARHDGSGKTVFGASDAAALFTIAVCAMWPTVMNTAVGVRAVPTDYLNVARVLKLSRAKTLFKVLLPATLPYMFTGFRLSLGIAWLVIVAVEMLTGRPGVGGFLWQEYNANHYAQIILCILTIGVIGLLLDRVMSLVEARFKSV